MEVFGVSQRAFRPQFLVHPAVFETLKRCRLLPLESELERQPPFEALRPKASPQLPFATLDRRPGRRNGVAHILWGQDGTHPPPSLPLASIRTVAAGGGGGESSFPMRRRRSYLVPPPSRLVIHETEIHPSAHVSPRAYVHEPSLAHALIPPLVRREASVVLLVSRNPCLYPYAL